MSEEDDLKRKGSKISLDSDLRKEDKQKNKDLKKEKTSISERAKDHLITFNHKRLGSYKFNYLKRNILFALLGMPLEDTEFDEFVDQPEDIMEKNIKKLLKDELLENIATIKKKKLRGDKRIQLYWRLTPKGEEVAMLLLEWFNSQVKDKTEKKE